MSTDPRTRLDEIDPRSRLAAIKARADAATEGPWEAFEDCNMILADVGPVREWLVGEPEGDLVLDWSNGTRPADAEFIAHARTDVDDMAAALTAVLDLHKKEPARYYGTDLNPHNEYDCQGCGEGKPWPCLTVRTIDRKMEATE